jgi:aspartate 1-decarboxylase
VRGLSEWVTRRAARLKTSLSLSVGAAAHLGKPGDRLTIMSFTEAEVAEAKFWKPKVIVLGERNAIITERGL